MVLRPQSVGLEVWVVPGLRRDARFAAISIFVVELKIFIFFLFQIVFLIVYLQLLRVQDASSCPVSQRHVLRNIGRL